MLKYADLIIFLLISVFVSSETIEGKYSVSMSSYNGTSEVYSHYSGDTLIIRIETSVVLNLVKVKNIAKIDTISKKPISIESKYKKFGFNSSGYIKFENRIIKSFMSDKKDTTILLTKQDPNDWLILPYFLRFYDDSVYSFSMIHGDFTIKKKISGAVTRWETDDKKLEIVFTGDTLTYLHADKVYMRRSM